jgi:hypothetical protein
MLANQAEPLGDGVDKSIGGCSAAAFGGDIKSDIVQVGRRAPGDMVRH